MNELENSFRVLTAEEAGLVAAGYLKPGKYYWDTDGNGKYTDGETIIAIQPEFSQLDEDGGSDGWYGGYDFTTANYFDEGGGDFQPNATPPDVNCLTQSQIDALSPEAREQYYVAVEAAEIAREIMLMPDHDTREYASLINRDANGVITHTPLAVGTATSVTPNMTGMANMGQFLGIIHSHPAVTFMDRVPDFKIYPTPDAAAVGGAGDWSSFDWYRQQMEASLVRDHGLSAAEAAVRTGNVSQFILGATGPVGSGSYGFHQYSNTDRDRITPGAKVNINLGLCGS